MRMDAAHATAPSEMTAKSVVPPPISTTSVPFGLSGSTPAPAAAATGCSIRYTRDAPACIPASMTARSSSSDTSGGTQINKFGRIKLPHPARFKNTFVMAPAIEQSVITPPRTGRTASKSSGVLPSMSRAFFPTQTTLPVLLRMATTDGSRKTIPFPSRYNSTDDVPKSIA